MNSKFKPGLVHTPITPFKRDHAVDYDTYAKVLEFHIKNGAEALALPMPEGEDMSLTDPELRQLLEFAMKQVKGRVPVIAHVSDAGTAIAIERAVHAEKTGVAAIVSHPPYFWHPKPAMIVEHLVRIAASVKLPFFVVNPPIESVGATLTSAMVLELVERVPSLAGIVDAGLEFVFMEEIMGNTRAKHPEFQLLAGQDYPVSAFALGGSGVFSPLSAIAPGLVKKTYDLCKARKFIEARGMQENIAELHHLLKEAGESGLKDGLGGIKTAMAAMGRECGVPRPPVRPLGEVERGRIAEAMRAMPYLAAEPRGW